jgi:hypothetical protein
MAHLRNYSQSLANQFELSTTRFIELPELQSSSDRSLTLEPFPNLADFRYRLYGTVLSKRMAHNLAKSLILEFENSILIISNSPITRRCANIKNPVHMALTVYALIREDGLAPYGPVR